MAVTYCPILASSILASFQHVLVYVGNYGVRIHSQLSLGNGQLATTKWSALNTH